MPEGLSPHDNGLLRQLRTPVGLAALGAAVISVSAWAIFGGWRWLPIPLAVLTVGLLAECVSTDKPTISARMAITTAAMIVGLLAAVTMTTDGLLGTPDKGGSVDVALAASATTTPAVDVEGATLTREDFDRLEACETALRQVADALRVAGDPTVGLADTASTTGDNSAARLRSCEVRMQAIALTLEP